MFNKNFMISLLSCKVIFGFTFINVFESDWNFEVITVSGYSDRDE